MRYFITSDIHGFYSILRKELKKNGFDFKDPNDKLVIVGDAFDRGEEAKQLLNFLIKLKKLDKLIYIKGNHESCMEFLLHQLKQKEDISLYHISNKTLFTLCQICDLNAISVISGDYNYQEIEKKMSKYLSLTKDLPYYYQIDNYILTHGYIPEDVTTMTSLKRASKKAWENAMWRNGIACAYFGQHIKNKIIVVGHFHTSFGHYNYHKIGSGEFEKDSEFGIYKDKQIIALDACTTYTKKLNMLVIEK